MSAVQEYFPTASYADRPVTTKLIIGPSSPPPATSDRLPFLDFLRAVSAHVIVWHHLAFYGPLSDEATFLFPRIFEFLSEHGRNAVQVFLVIGGFVTAQSLGKRREFALKDAVRTIKRRYVRIAGPYLAALMIAVVANSVAQAWMEHHSISAFPTIPQFLAHAVFLQDLLGYEALSAGVWYLAIDFQLVLLAIGLWWLAQRTASATKISPFVWSQVLLLPLAIASWFWFNRHSEWDVWAGYFLGNYAVGLIASWTLSRRLPPWVFWLYLALAGAALVTEFRPRLAVGLTTGLMIFVAGRSGWLGSLPLPRWLSFAGTSSYSLFLIHFPACLVVNAILSNYVLDSPALCVAGLSLAYGLSILASIVFYFAIERRFQGEPPVRCAATIRSVGMTDFPNVLSRNTGR
jgi:peptidoglycan/LPS O-acetylase OafA/YrhL